MSEVDVWEAASNPDNVFKVMLLIQIYVEFSLGCLVRVLSNMLVVCFGHRVDGPDEPKCIH